MISICVIGLGYVGLPICVELSKKFKVIGYDTNKKRVNELIFGHDSNNVFKKKDLINNIKYTYSYHDIRESNFYIICVPTPINKYKKPNLKPVNDTFSLLNKVLKKNDIIILESTVYPGITKQNSNKLEKKTNLKNGKDFFLSYSPERIDPGSDKTLKNIDKILAIETNNNLIKKKIIKVYKNLSKKLIITRYIKEAETAKVIENIQRDMNIAFFNQILIICKKLKLNYKEVIKLASTKWNFLKFNPGLVGGHCLPVDPYYLLYLAEKNKIKFDLISGSRKINNFMANYVVENIKENMNSKQKKNTKNILLLGITYKYGVSDMRNSLSLKIYQKLRENGYKVCVFDPFCSDRKINLIQNINKIKKNTLIVPLLKGNKIKGFLKSIRNKLNFKFIDPLYYYN